MDGARIFNKVTGCFYLGTDRESSAYGGYPNPSSIYFSASKSNTLYGAANEIRPVNMSIRVWRKTG